MTDHRPRYDTWWSKIVISVFLLVVGGLVNQFLNIPVQQMHQDDRLNTLEKHMEYNDRRLDDFEQQHRIMMEQLDALKKAHGVR